MDINKPGLTSSVVDFSIISAEEFDRRQKLKFQNKHEQKPEQKREPEPPKKTEEVPTEVPPKTSIEEPISEPPIIIQEDSIQEQEKNVEKYMEDVTNIIQQKTRNAYKTVINKISDEFEKSAKPPIAYLSIQTHMLIDLALLEISQQEFSSLVKKNRESRRLEKDYDFEVYINLIAECKSDIENLLNEKLENVLNDCKIDIDTYNRSYEYWAEKDKGFA